MNQCAFKLSQNKKTNKFYLSLYKIFGEEITHLFIKEIPATEFNYLHNNFPYLIHYDKEDYKLLISHEQLLKA